MASNILSHQHLMGPAVMAGGTLKFKGRAVNGVHAPQIFHFNHCGFAFFGQLAT